MNMRSDELTYRERELRWKRILRERAKTEKFMKNRRRQKKEAAQRQQAIVKRAAAEYVPELDDALDQALERNR